MKRSSRSLLQNRSPLPGFVVPYSPNVSSFRHHFTLHKKKPPSIQYIVFNLARTRCEPMQLFFFIAAECVYFLLVIETIMSPRRLVFVLLFLMLILHVIGRNKMRFLRHQTRNTWKVNTSKHSLNSLFNVGNSGIYNMKTLIFSTFRSLILLTFELWVSLSLAFYISSG